MAGLGIEGKAARPPQRRSHCAREHPWSPQPCLNPLSFNPFGLPFWILLSAHCKNFPNLEVLCVHLPTWHSYICGASWAADGGSVSLGPLSHLGKGTRKRRGQCSPLRSYLLFTSCQGGSPIKWLFRAFKTTNQTCQNL